MNAPLNRHSNILDFSLSSLLRRKTKNLSLLVVYTLIVFVIASLIFFVQALKREAAQLLKEAPDMVVQRMIAGRHDLIPASYGEKISDIRGVASVSPRLWGYYYDQVFGANYTLLVPEEKLVEPGSIMIGAGVARNQRVQASDMLTLKTSANAALLLTVQGIYPSSSELISSDLIVLSAEDFQAMFNLPPGQATDLAVTVAKPAGTGHRGHQDRGAVPRHPPDPEERDPEDLRFALRVARRHDGGDPGRGGAFLHHLRLGQGHRPFRRRAQGDRHPQVHRLGDLGCAAAEVLGRDRHLADGISGGGRAGLRAMCSFSRQRCSSMPSRDGRSSIRSSGWFRLSMPIS